MNVAPKCGLCGANVRPRAPACPVCGGMGRCPCGRIADLVRCSDREPSQRRCRRCYEGPRNGSTKHPQRGPRGGIQP